MINDARGLPLSTASAEAAAAFDATVEAYLSYRTTIADHMKACLAADPDFAMGHCLRGYLMMSFMSTALHGKAREALERAEALQARASGRERASIAALRAWLQGDPARACLIWDEVLTEHPHDILALRLQHHATFWLGRSLSLRDSIARVIGQWDESLPGYGYALGMYAFGLEEAGDYAEAEDKGRQAVALNEDDLWAIHAVAHVLEMRGRLDEGVEWLTRPQADWSARNAMREHLWWHKALFLIEQGATDEALWLYDDKVRAEPSDFYLDIQNAASLLARLQFEGVDVGERWYELAKVCATKLDDHVLPFTDLHGVMALAQAGRDMDAGRAIASLQVFGEAPGVLAAGTVAPLALPLARAIAAHARGDHAGAVDLLLPLRNDYARLGASHAQRDLFHQLLIDAALRGGCWKLARRLLEERLAARPVSHGGWLRLAQVLDKLEAHRLADKARERAAAVALDAAA